MVDYNSQIKEIEKQMSETKYNKSTQLAFGIMKAKIAKLKEKEIARASSGSAGTGFVVSRSGDATVILLGFPSVGKSSILNSLTDAHSEVAAYAFTTLTVVPGVLKFMDATIQILDVPGIVSGAASGKGRGREVLSAMHSADLALVVLDARQPQCYNAIMKEVRDAHIRINERKPDVKIKKTTKGGIDFATTVKLTKIDQKTVESILREFRLNNCQIVIRDDINADQLIDVIEGNKKYISGVVIVNKSDLLTQKQMDEIKKKYPVDIFISTYSRLNIDELKKVVYKKLNFIRIYTKEQGKPADMHEPLIMFAGTTIQDVCNKLHKDFVKRFRYAKVWGKSAKFPGQILSLNHVMLDKDVIEVHIR